MPPTQWVKLPEQARVAERVDICQDAGTGGRKAGNRLKQSVGIFRNVSADNEGQRPAHTDHDPDHRDTDKALFGKIIRAVIFSDTEV